MYELLGRARSRSDRLAKPFRQPSASKELLGLAWVVLRMHVGHAPRSYRVDLDDGLLVENSVVWHSRRKDKEAAGRQRLGLARVGLLAHPQPRCSRDDCDNLVHRVEVRRVSPPAETSRRRCPAPKPAPAAPKTAAPQLMQPRSRGSCNSGKGGGESLSRFSPEPSKWFRLSVPDNLRCEADQPGSQRARRVSAADPQQTSFRRVRKRSCCDVVALTWRSFPPVHGCSPRGGR